MSQASDGDTVKINYTGKLDSGDVFDTSEGRAPLEFTIGQNTIIPTLESAVVGMAEGDTATVAIAAADAYGQRSPEAIQKVERSAIPEGIELATGTQLQASDGAGNQMLLTVVELDEETVTLDGNHPLAGENLTFEIELVEIVSAGD